MERFLFFSRAALEFLVVTGRQPDVLHLHDWQSSAVVRHSQLDRFQCPGVSCGRWQRDCVSTAACVAAPQRAFTHVIATLALCACTSLVSCGCLWPVRIVCATQAPLLAHEYRQRGLSRPRTMLTIHNIAFQVRKAPGVDPGLAASCSQLCALVAQAPVAVPRIHALFIATSATSLQLVVLHAVTSTDAACGRLVVLQGWMTPDVLSRAGLDADALAQPHLMLDDTRPGFRPGTHDVCLMRGGVVFSDRVTTVSPTYACEVYRPEFGFGMQVGRTLGHSP